MVLVVLLLTLWRGHCTVNTVNIILLTDKVPIYVPQVVPRQYQSEEHHFNSVQRRKRSAMSLADPAEIMKTRGSTPLEESCELTRCLTPEEIMNLNQGRPASSPSDRARLFSITKGFKNPFTKSRGKKEKEMRDRLVSPDKEQQLFLQGLQYQMQPQTHPHHQQQQQQGWGTPPSRHHHHHHKHGSPATGRATLDRFEGLLSVGLGGAVGGVSGVVG